MWVIIKLEPRGFGAWGEASGGIKNEKGRNMARREKGGEDREGLGTGRVRGWNTDEIYRTVSGLRHFQTVGVVTLSGGHRSGRCVLWFVREEQGLLYPPGVCFRREDALHEGFWWHPLHWQHGTPTLSVVAGPAHAHTHAYTQVIRTLCGHIMAPTTSNANPNILLTSIHRYSANAELYCIFS